MLGNAWWIESHASSTFCVCRLHITLLLLWVMRKRLRLLTAVRCPKIPPRHKLHSLRAHRTDFFAPFALLLRPSHRYPQFIDKLRIVANGGKGGDGCISLEGKTASVRLRFIGEGGGSVAALQAVEASGALRYDTTSSVLRSVHGGWKFLSASCCLLSYTAAAQFYHECCWSHVIEPALLIRQMMPHL